MDPKEDVQPKVKTNKPKVKKKKHVGLWVTLGIVFSLIVAPVAALYICFYDGNRTTNVLNPDFDYKKNYIDSTFNALETIEDNNGLLKFQVTKETFNEALTKGLNDFTKDNQKIKEMITGVSLETTDEFYTFIFDFNFKNIFKTRLFIETKYKEDVIDNESSLVFRINNVKLGRISGIDDLVNRIAPNLLSDDFVSGMFSNLGFSFKSNLKDKIVYYPKSSFKNDIISKINISSPLYESAIKMMFAPELLNIHFDKDAFKANTDLSVFAENQNFVTNDKKNSVDWKSIKLKTREILNGLGTSIGSLQDADLYNYLVNGYDRTPDSVKDKLSPLDLSPYGIASKEDYKGVWSTTKQTGKIYLPEKDLKELLIDQVTLENIALNKIGVISEDQLNETLMSSNAIGECYTLRSVDSNGNILFTPMTITNMYANVIQDSLKLVITVSINGYDTNLCINAKFDNFESETYNTTFKLKVDEMYYGTRVVDNDFAERIFDLISKALDIDSTFGFDKNTKEISMNFLSAIEESGHKSDIDLVGTPAFRLIGTSLEDSGQLEFIIVPH